jgi:hypothetical protein
MLHLAITLQIVHLLYNQVATLFDLFPFNGVRFYSWRERLAEAGVNFAIMAFPLVGFILHVPLLMEAGVMCFFVLLGGECATWWIPYFFGPSPKWLEIYSRVHRPTITVLPRRGTNPVPNLEHLILMVLTLVTTVVSLRAYHATTGSFFPHWWVTMQVAAFMISGVVFQCCIKGKKQPPEPTPPSGVAH